MTVVRFKTEEFEAALNQEFEGLWTFAGIYDGERRYEVSGDYARVVVRSSIGKDGVAADSGDDSIRIWLEIVHKNGGWHPVKKLDTWTTRVEGWERRMNGKIKILLDHASRVNRPAENCDCGRSKSVWFTAKGNNVGRPAMKCFWCQKGFVWLDEPLPAAEEEEVSLGAESEVSSPAPEPDNDIIAQMAAIANKAFEKVEEKEKREPNEQQLALIQSPVNGPSRALANAGSGKTFSLEERYKFLVDSGVDPRTIVMVTFTKGMSMEMGERVMRRVPSIVGTMAEQQICSIHAFCNRVLQGEGIGLQIPSKSYEVKRMLQQIAKDLWPFVDNPDLSVTRPTWEELLRAFGNAKNRLMRPDNDYDMYAEWWGSYHAQRLVEARKRFDIGMKSKGWWTFGDMLYEMEKRLNDDRDFLERCRGRYQYIMVDEGQDTNGQAMRILTAIAQPKNNIMIVGDPDQLLFRFTGATPEENMYDGFTERYPDGITLFLETNYRSCATIVDAGNRLIRNNYTDAGGPYDEIYRKNCRPKPDAENGAPINWNWYETAEDEAIGVVDTILELLAAGYKPGDIFVSSRTRAQLAYLEPPLTQAGVPAINITGGSFWQLRHIRQVLDYMRLVLDNDDSDALRNIYNIASNEMRDRYGEYCPTRWLGNSFLGAVNKVYNRETMQNAMYGYRGWTDGITDLLKFMDGLEDVMSKDSPGDAVRYIIDNALYKYLKYEEGLKDDDDVGKTADLETVYLVASKFDSIDKFFERIDAAIKAAEDAKNKNWGEYVVLSTVHRLKGMERPVMFGIGWCEGERYLKDGSVVPAGLLPHTFSLTEPPANGALSINDKGRVEDERCIAYVAITRAKDLVYLSGYQYRDNAVFRPSRFASEILESSSLE